MVLTLIIIAIIFGPFFVFKIAIIFGPVINIIANIFGPPLGPTRLRKVDHGYHSNRLDETNGMKPILSPFVLILVIKNVIEVEKNVQNAL